MLPFYKPVASFTFSLFLSIALLAQNFVPDPGFSDCGVNYGVYFGNNDIPKVKVSRILVNGRILTAGNLLNNSGAFSIGMAQFTSQGNSDSAFGTNGTVATKYFHSSFINQVIVTPQHTIVSAGGVKEGPLDPFYPAFFQFNSNGNPTPSLRDSGMAKFSFDDNSSGILHDVVHLNPGYVGVGIASAFNGSGKAGLGIIKITELGYLDSSFFSAGPHPGKNFWEMPGVQEVKMQMINEKFAIPFIQDDGTGKKLKIAQVNADGVLVSGYGNGGIFNSGLEAELLLTEKQADGKLLIGGITGGTVKQIQLIRLNSETLDYDNGFGINGRVVIPTLGNAGDDNILCDVEQQPDGKLLLLGYMEEPNTQRKLSMVIRLLQNGMLDSTFNQVGYMTLENNELRVGWKTINSTDSFNFVMASNSFALAKFVPEDDLLSYKPVAGFNYIQNQQTIVFNNTSRNVTNAFWDFGDRSSSQQFNPEHTYQHPGLFRVYLSTSSICYGADTFANIGIKGIYKMTPSRSSNNGFLATEIDGYGFDENSLVKVINGLESITAQNVFYNAGTNGLQANFKFDNALTGRYDLVVTTGSRSDTLRKALDLRKQFVGKQWIYVGGLKDVVSSSSFGRRGHYTVHYGVKGNASQYLLPLSIKITGKDLYPRLVTPLDKLADTTNLPDSMRPEENGFYRLYDEIKQDSVWVLYLRKLIVNAGVNYEFTFSITTKSVDTFNIAAAIGGSLFDKSQTDELYNQRGTGTNNVCNNCIKCILDLAGFIPGPAGCTAGVLGVACSAADLATNPSPGLGGVVNLGVDILGTAIGCGSGTSGAGGNLLKQMGKSLLGDILDQRDKYNTLSDCGQALVNVESGGDCDSPGDSNDRDDIIRRSGDPNAKVGPGPGDGLNYINKTDNLFYTTYFENVATATAPAFEVVITDTLDKSVMDVSTFQFVNFGFGENQYSIYNNKDSFAQNIPIPGKAIVVNVRGAIDTAKGIVNWQFRTLDSTTMNLITDIDKGFLPPNTDGISGTGFVAYSIEQQPANTHLTTIANRAKIVFDFNDPIFTETWINTVDTVKPVSNVLPQFTVLSDSTFSVKWTGSDAQAGIKNYRVAIAQNDTGFFVLGVYQRDSTIVKGTAGYTYKFYSIAEDKAGNIEAAPAQPMSNPQAVFTFNPALPVTLVSFTAEKLNRQVQLQWVTATEINTSHFEVEHSTDGRIYTAIARLNAAGNATIQHTYKHIHKNPSEGINYYRIKMADKDGRFTYTSIRSIRFNDAPLMVVHPNPAFNSVQVSVTDLGGNFRMVNSIGKTVLQQPVLGNQTNINISHLKPGVYFVIYSGKDGSQAQQKLVVQ